MATGDILTKTVATAAFTISLGGLANGSAQQSMDGSPRCPRTRDGLDLDAHEPGLRNLREANEELVISALSTRESGAQTQKAQHRQMELVAAVARRLRNPLSSMRTVADLMEQARTGEAPSEQVQVIIKNQVAHMSRLVEELIDAARISGCALPLERSTFDITQAISSAVQVCRPTMEAKLQHFEMRLPLSEVRVNGDSMRLTQVFSDLLNNASKYTGAGGAIALRLAVSEEVVTVTVSDHGIGITPEALATIFNLAVQETRALPLRDGGLGARLAIARHLVEAHGGTLVGKSAGSDCGSEFVVTLPLADPHVASQVS